MAMNIKRAFITKNGIWIVYVPNSPNPEILRQPIEIELQIGQLWIHNLNNIIYKIKNLDYLNMELEIFANVKNKKTSQRFKSKIEITYFLDNYHLIQHAKDKKPHKKRKIKVPENKGDLNIL